MKREPVNGEREENGWLAKTLQHSTESGEGCLDAETLAAWADGGLSAPAAAAVELHASTCSRCSAMLAAIERTAPAAPVRDAWTRARLFRWLVPLTAVATAVAIWIAVPDRPVTPVPSSPARDLQLPSERTDAGAQVPVPVPVPEPRTLKQSPAPSTQNQEPQAAPESLAQLRDEMRREAAKPEPFGAQSAMETPAAAPAAPAGPPPPAPAPMPPPAVAEDRVAETAPMAERRSSLAKTAMTSESTSGANPLARWRVLNFLSIERSTDGGKTWMKTIPPPGIAPANPDSVTILSIRAIDDVRAVVRTSDGSDFYTSNGGLTWAR
jgi:hypothetical protein